MTTDTLVNNLRDKHPYGYDSRDSFTIPTHPELNRIAIKERIDAEYLLWAVLRHYTSQTGESSHFLKADVYSIALESGLSWTRRHFNRVIADGNGIFWGTDTQRIYIRSFKRVYNLLADQQAKSVPSARFVMIQVHKSAAARRAEFYWSWFVEKEEQTIARDTMAVLFGLSHDQQRDYEKLLGKRLIIQTNYCHIDSDLYAENLSNLPAHSFEFKQEKFIDNRVTYVNVVAYQLPNTFIARKSQHGESPLRFAPNRALKASRTLYRHTLACSYHERCYFDFYDEWEKSMNGQAYIRTYYQGKKRIWRQGHFF